MKVESSGLLKVSVPIPGISEIHFVAYQHAIRNGHPERISQCFDDFKHGVEPQTSRWISLAAPLVGELGPFDVIIRALGSDELTVRRGSPLDRLCLAIAGEGGSAYDPERLHKTRVTRRLQGLGGKAAHRREMVDAFSFNAAGLKAASRILIVDDTLTTGATLEAIATEIRRVLPDANMSAFILAKAGGATANSRLDAEHSSALKPEVATEDVRPKNGAARTPRKRSRPSEPAVRHASSSMPAKRTTSGGGRVTSGIVSLAVIALAFVILGAIVPIRSGKNSPLPITDDFSRLAIQNAPAPVPAPIPIPVVRSVTPSDRKNPHPGIIIIPHVGLRADHSFDARSLPGIAVRNGEKTEILRRFSPERGPSWLQLRTKSGKVGWVIASVVKDVKSGTSL